MDKEFEEKCLNRRTITVEPAVSRIEDDRTMQHLSKQHKNNSEYFLEGAKNLLNSPTPLLAVIIGHFAMEHKGNQLLALHGYKAESHICTQIGLSRIAGKKSLAKKLSDVFAFGRPYIRIADENKPMPPKMLESIILKKNKDKIRWDAEICKGASIGDIGKKKLGYFLRESGREFDNVKNSLGKLGLLKSGRPVNAAVMLFGKNPEKLFPNARLRCAVFGTTDTSVTIDMQDFEGDLFYLIEKAQEYILENIHIGMRLEGLRRIDVPEIDKSALREAIINAFCHRDYWKFDSVNVAVFKDRVEIRSPGLLYGNLTIDKIKKEMVSERRNELIADMLHRIHFIEKWGRGISLILSKEPLTDFKEVGQHFMAVFKRKPEEKDLENLNENQRKIIAEVKRNPPTTQNPAIACPKSVW